MPSWQYTKDTPKEDRFLSESHPIIYTNRNFMGTPKENKGSKGSVEKKEFQELFIWDWFWLNTKSLDIITNLRVHI